VLGTLEFDHLFRLRLVIARFGELDLAGWWNTRGQLGRLGATVLRRGFPRTHRFAQARSVFAVARERCRTVFDPPLCATLWTIPEDLEEEFEAHWECWIERTGELGAFFEALESLGGDDSPTPGSTASKAAAT